MTKKLKNKKSQKYRQQTRSHGVSPEERKKVYDRNDLRKR